MKVWFCIATTWRKQCAQTFGVMEVLRLLLFGICFAPLVMGDACNSLDGYWYNQLGSEILLRHGKDGRLTGEYRTAVERKTGAAGVNHSKILGIKIDGLFTGLAKFSVNNCVCMCCYRYFSLMHGTVASLPNPWIYIDRLRNLPIVKKLLKTLVLSRTNSLLSIRQVGFSLL